MIFTNKYARKIVWGIGFALFCATLALIYSVLSRKEKRIYVTFKGHSKELFSLTDFVIFFIMTFLASIRLNVGSDYYNYYVMFNNVHRDITITRDKIVAQSGYDLLSYIVKQFTDNEYAIFMVIAIIIYGFLFHLIKDEVEDRPAAFTCYLFLGFFANSLNILKQCIAMVLVMSFYRMLKQKRFVKCVLFAILAVLFHYSAVFGIIIILIFSFFKIHPSRKLFLMSIAVGIFSLFFLPQLIMLIINFIPSASGYGIYINWRRNNQIRLVLGVIGSSLMYAFLIFNILKNRELIKNVNKTRYFEISFLIVGLFINIAAIRIWVMQRMSLYFYQFIILVLPAMFEGMDVNERKKTKRIIYITMFAYLIFSGIFLGDNEYYSYNTIFSGDKPIYDADFNRMFQ